MIDVTVAGRSVSLEAASVTQALRTTAPEPIRDHFVMIGGRRFPPKQALEQATGIDRADFTTHQARSILRKLGFEVGRLRPQRAGEHAVAYEDAKGAEVWIAVKDRRTIARAASPGELVAGLRAQGLRADMVLREGPPTRDEPIGF